MTQKENGERRKVGSRISCSSSVPWVCVVRERKRVWVGTAGGCGVWLQPAALPTGRPSIHTSVSHRHSLACYCMLGGAFVAISCWWHHTHRSLVQAIEASPTTHQNTQFILPSVNLSAPYRGKVSSRRRQQLMYLCWRETQQWVNVHSWQLSSEPSAHPRTHGPAQTETKQEAKVIWQKLHRMTMRDSGASLASQSSSICSLGDQDDVSKCYNTIPPQLISIQWMEA